MRIGVILYEIFYACKILEEEKESFQYAKKLKANSRDKKEFSVFKGYQNKFKYSFLIIAGYYG